jgi:RNA polymerase sigma-70 factor (ECF subfamily)
MSAKPTDSGLVDRTLEGDEDALAELYRRYAPDAYEVAIRLTGSGSDAADVTQNVFLGLPDALDSYKGQGELGAWIRRIATREALLFLRHEKRQAKWQRRAARRSHEDASTDRVEARVVLEQALQAMPDELRVAYVLKEVEGYSHDEIADLLGITANLSSVRLYRARRWLKKRLGGKI